MTFRNELNSKHDSWLHHHSIFCLFQYFLDFADFKCHNFKFYVWMDSTSKTINHTCKWYLLGSGPSMNNDGINKMRFILFNLFAWFLKWRLIKLILRKLILYNTKHFQYYLKSAKIVIFGKNGNFELNFGIQRPIRRKWEQINV